MNKSDPRTGFEWTQAEQAVLDGQRDNRSELRRLSAINAELLDALVALRSVEFGHSEEDICALRISTDALIAKAQGEQL